jgi:hypothetical protein
MTLPLEPGTVHIAGFEVQFAERIRQRCSWCGEVLIDQELALVTMHPWSEFTVWPAGKQILHDGNLWTVLEDEPGDMPGTTNVDLRSCMRLPPELTISTKGQTDE